MFRIVTRLSRPAPHGAPAHVARPSSALLLRLAVVGLLLGLLLGPTPTRPAYAAGFVVNHAADLDDFFRGDGQCRTSVGSCTLRAAIQEANALLGLDTITFNIITTGLPPTISPLSPLPTITSPVVIDGTTQPGFAGTPIVELNGQFAGPAANGLTITSGGSTVGGLVINRFSQAGIRLEGAGSNALHRNFIGTDVGGAVALGNGTGVFILAPSNGIGFPGAGNLISGNVGSGVRIEGPLATGNVVRANLIGTDRTGTVALRNGSDGVLIDQAPANTIGGTGAGDGNLISGNGTNGVEIRGGFDRLDRPIGGGNVVVGNHIGTDVNVAAKLGNGVHGVRIFLANLNQIGRPELGNDISGNGGSGVVIEGVFQDCEGENTIRNVVQHNFIGTDRTGTIPLGNGEDGVVLDSAQENSIGVPGAGNLISGNARSGVRLTGCQTHGNRVRANLIGTDSFGTSRLDNGGHGVFIHNASSNTIGGTAAGEGNLISGNSGNGMEIVGRSANTVVGNHIGTDVTVTAKLGNSLHGVRIVDAPRNKIGLPELGNDISGNAGIGVVIQGSQATGNVVQHNTIGTDRSGTVALGNREGVVIDGAPNNTIGVPGAGNLISGNGGAGVVISGASGNRLEANLIGTNVTGTKPLGNRLDGVLIEFGAADGNTIGGTLRAARNTIAFNKGRGVAVVSGTRNAIRGNPIFGNGGLGIDLQGAADTPASPVTPNDPGDGDTGPNTLQNFPVVTGASAPGFFGGAVISGRLESTPSTSFTLEFFASPTCDPSGHGEGRRFLARRTVVTNLTGSASFLFSLPPKTKLPVGQSVTTTATDPAGNTSEFSRCTRVTLAAPLDDAEQQNGSSEAIPPTDEWEEQDE